MDYKDIDEIEIRKVKLVVFSPTGSSLSVAKMIGEVQICAGGGAARDDREAAGGVRGEKGERFFLRVNVPVAVEERRLKERQL